MSFPFVSRRTAILATVSLIAVPLCLLSPTIARAAEGDMPMTLDWVFSEEGKAAAAIPTTTWLADGRLVIRDPTIADDERTLEIVNPSDGSRRPLVDRSKALASLDGLLGVDEPTKELSAPDAIHEDGRWAVYTIEDDIFLLDLNDSSFRRLTDTDATEKSPRMAPDGSAVAFIRANDLYLHDLESGKERRLTTSGSDTLLNGTVSWVYWEEIFGRTDRGFLWSPDSKSIAYLQTDESGVPLVSFVDFAPNVPAVIQQRYPKTGEANPRVRVGVLDVADASTTWADMGSYPHEYIVRVTWLPDSSRYCVATMDRSQKNVDLFLVETGNGAARHLMRESDPGWVNLHDDLHFLEDGKRFVWSSERDGYAHLYLHSLEDGRELGRITSGEWAVQSSGGVFWLSQAISAIDEAGGWIYYTGMEKSSIERHLYRSRLDGSGMERLTREDGTHRIVFSPDGRRYVDSWSSVSTPPSIHVYDADGTRVATVHASNIAAYDEVTLQPVELFTIKAKDGFEMPAWIIKPPGFKKKNRYPVVIYVYGGPSAPTVANRWSAGNRGHWEQVLAANGYIVLRVDNRSATAISKKLENLILADGYGSVEMSDLLDGVAWLKSQSYVDPERVGIWGWSGGGSYTLLSMTTSKEFKAGVAVAAVSDWHYYDTKWAEAFMKRPQDNPDGYEATSHAKRAKELHGRLLLVHGTYDDNVHPQNAWRFTDEAIAAGKLIEMMIYPMRKHGISDDAAQKHLYRTMLSFWDRNLK